MEKLDINWNKSGIYKIINIINNNYYIGSAKSIRKRLSLHITLLKKNKHHSKHLQNAWNKYGEESFKSEIIEECEIQYLIKKEQYYIDILNPVYNSLKIAGSNLGFKQPKSFYMKMSKPIVKIDKSGNLIKEYNSINEASRIENINNTCISSCTNGRLNTYKNFIWLKKKDYINCDIKDILYKRIEIPKENYKNKLKEHSLKMKGKTMNLKKGKIIQINRETNTIKEWNSIKEACIKMGYKVPGNIGLVLKGKRKSAYNCYWKLKK